MLCAAALLDIKVGARATPRAPRVRGRCGRAGAAGARARGRTGAGDRAWIAAGAAMAEVSLWAQQDSLHHSLHQRMSQVCSTLRSHCRAARDLTGDTKQQDMGDGVRNALASLIEALGEGGANADKSASLFGRLGGHQSLLQLLEAEGEAGEDLRDLAARAAELCMSFCSRFPMKAGALDAENDCDLMRCEISIDSPLNKTGAPVKVHLMRRSNPDDTGSRPVIAISNMLWAGSIVLVRYLQQQTARADIWPELSERDSDAAEDWAPGAGGAGVLEIGAGLGLAGLGAAILAKETGRVARITITDCDSLSVDMVRACLRSNDLDGDKGGVSTCAHVLDWDALDAFRERCPEARHKYQLILGAEVCHEMSHAAGVMRVVKELMAEGGRTVLVLGARKHRFGVAELQELLASDPHLLHTVVDVDPALTHELESLKEGMLQLQLYNICWAPDHAPPVESN